MQQISALRRPGRPDLFAQVSRLYRDRTPPLLAQIEEATARGELQAVAGAAQQPPATTGDPVFRSDTRLVVLHATVVDKATGEDDYRSEVWIVDAGRVGAGAVAKVAVPVRLRPQVHGWWVPAAELARARTLKGQV